MEEFRDELIKIQESIDSIKAELDKAKKLDKLMSDEVFLEIIIEDLLEGKARKLADRLVYDKNSRESEESILTSLCGLREVRNYINDGVNMVPVLKARLAKEEQYYKEQSSKNYTIGDSIDD